MYVAPSGSAVVIGAVVSSVIVYTSVFTDSVFPAVSTAKNWSMVVVDIGMAVE